MEKGPGDEVDHMKTFLALAAEVKWSNLKPETIVCVGKFLGAPFIILTVGNALKCILSQSKGRGRNIFCFQGASFRSFVPGPPKSLSGPASF